MTWRAKATILLLLKDTKLAVVTSRAETSKLGIACLSGGWFPGVPVAQGAFVCSLLVTGFVFGQSEFARDLVSGEFCLIVMAFSD